MNTLRYLHRLACCLLVLLAGSAGAGVYQYVDPVSGMVVISNVAPVARTPAGKPAAGRDSAGNGEAAPAGFPRISTQRQRDMDRDRRAILQDELDRERSALAAATASRAASEALARHASNIAALQRELGAVAGRSHN